MTTPQETALELLEDQLRFEYSIAAGVAAGTSSHRAEMARETRIPNLRAAIKLVKEQPIAPNTYTAPIITPEQALQLSDQWVKEQKS